MIEKSRREIFTQLLRAVKYWAKSKFKIWKYLFIIIHYRATHLFESIWLFEWNIFDIDGHKNLHFISNWGFAIFT